MVVSKDIIIYFGGVPHYLLPLLIFSCCHHVSLYALIHTQERAHNYRVPCFQHVGPCQIWEEGTTNRCHHVSLYALIHTQERAQICRPLPNMRGRDRQFIEFSLWQFCSLLSFLFERIYPWTIVTIIFIYVSLLQSYSLPFFFCLVECNSRHLLVEAVITIK